MVLCSQLTDVQVVYYICHPCGPQDLLTTLWTVASLLGVSPFARLSPKQSLIYQMSPHPHPRAGWMFLSSEERVKFRQATCCEAVSLSLLVLIFIILNDNAVSTQEGSLNSQMVAGFFCQSSVSF